MLRLSHLTNFETFLGTSFSMALEHMTSQKEGSLYCDKMYYSLHMDPRQEIRGS